MKRLICTGIIVLLFTGLIFAAGESESDGAAAYPSNQSKSSFRIVPVVEQI